MQEVAKHPGTVISITEGSVKVNITTLSACGTCSAHAHCGFAESKDREIDVDTADWQNYQVGQHVIVSVNEGLGFLAVVWSYLLPAVLLLAGIITLLCVTHNEPLSVLITLIIIAIYYFLLYHYRSHLQRRFTFGISAE
jgi:positive regulator of sigma E activity